MAIECEKCGLFNPDGSSTCDCGFHFVPGAPTATKRPVPGSVWLFLAGLLGVAILRVYSLATAPPRRYQWQPSSSDLQGDFVVWFIWAFGAFVLALNLLSRKNWARVALGIWTLPLGVFLLMSPAARSFTSGEDGPVELGLR